MHYQDKAKNTILLANSFFFLTVTQLIPRGLFNSKTQFRFCCMRKFNKSGNIFGIAHVEFGTGNNNRLIGGVCAVSYVGRGDRF